MAKAYSDDLRRKLLEAYLQKEGSLPELAVRFRVSASWARGISAALGRTGNMEKPAAGRRGRKSKITAGVENRLREWIGAQADLTLMELQARLQQELRLQVSIGRLWGVLREMGLRLKKSRSTPPSKTPRQVSSSVSRGGKRRAKSIGKS